MKLIRQIWLYGVAGFYALSACIFAVALGSYDPLDPSWWRTIVPESVPHNLLGHFGAHCAAFLIFLGGSAAWIVPLACAVVAVTVVVSQSTQLSIERCIAAISFFFFRATFVAAQMPSGADGGIIGHSMLLLLSPFFDYPLIAFISWYGSLTALFVWWQFAGLGWLYQQGRLFFLSAYSRNWLQKFNFLSLVRAILKAFNGNFFSKQELVSTPASFDTGHYSLEEDSQLFEKKTSDACWPDAPYQLPPLTLFKYVQKTDTTYDRRVAEQKDQGRLLEQKLLQFGIRGSITNVTVGPILTLFEYEPASDIKLSRITAFEDDLALALQAVSVRIIAPLPGKAVVGIEVAYQETGEVSFASLVHSSAFQKRSGALPLILGKDVVGTPTFIDLALAPHLLVAGTTGSGKSVGLHSMIATLLATKTPDELRLVLIDPKQLEFAGYEQIPHLCAPVISDPRTVLPVFAWLVDTMQERYQIMASARVRTIAEYNLQHPENFLPYIVVVVDELADLMVTAGRQIEEYLLRIAQMARAAGIHMIVATQRPSVDVLTGLIKVNFPTRIAFRVASKIDSRTIIDTGGAERLLGKGDMLFLSTSGSLVRLHGAYSTKQDLAALVEYVRSQGKSHYLFQAHQLTPVDGGSHDPLYQELIQFLQTVEEISISLIQRRFRIGYNRSARLVEQLQQEQRVIDCPGSKMKKVVK